MGIEHQLGKMQQQFFEHLASIQETCVEICMIQHKCNDEHVKSMLYDVTYEVVTEIMELIDGYSGYSDNKHDIINTVTGEHLKENPSIELHDQTEGFLRYE